MKAGLKDVRPAHYVALDGSGIGLQGESLHRPP